MLSLWRCCTPIFAWDNAAFPFNRLKVSSLKNADACEGESPCGQAICRNGACDNNAAWGAEQPIEARRRYPDPQRSPSDWNRVQSAFCSCGDQGERGSGAWKEGGKREGEAEAVKTWLDILGP